MAQQSSRLIFKNANRVAKGKQPDKLFSYLAQTEELTASKSTATTVAEFSSLDHIERTLAVRAAQSVKVVSGMLNASTAPKKQ